MSDKLTELAEALGGQPSPVGGATQARVMRGIAQRSGAASRKTLADELKLSAATVSKSVARLIELGFAEDGEPHRGAKGRPQTPVTWLRRYVSIGVRIVDRDSRPVSLVGTIVDLAGTQPPGFEKATHRDVTGEGQADDEVFLKELTAFVRRLRGRVRRHAGLELLGCGVSLGGHVDHGLIERSYATGWGPSDGGWTDSNGVALGKHLEDELGIPVVVDNDVKAIAVLTNLTSRPADSYAVISVMNDGVGGALVLQGDLWRGRHGLAGEIGHQHAGETFGRLRIEADLPRCRCGQQGHIEAFAAPHAILKRAGADDLYKLAMSPRRAGDAEKLFEQGGRAIGRGIVSMILWADPDRVLLYLPPELDVDDPLLAGHRYVSAMRAEVTSAFSVGRLTPVDMIFQSGREMEELGARASGMLVLGRLIDKVAVRGIEKG